jgi:arylsulfatase A-like enzyme
MSNTSPSDGRWKTFRPFALGLTLLVDPRRRSASRIRKTSRSVVLGLTLLVDPRRRSASRIRKNFRSVVLSLTLLSTGLACSQPEAEVLRPALRVVDVIDGERPRLCRVGDEFRRSLGCPRRLRLAQWEQKLPRDRRIRRDRILPEDTTAIPLILEAQVRNGPVATWQTIALGPFSAEQSSQPLEFDLPAGNWRGEIELGLFGYPLPPAEQTFSTSDIEIPDHATMQFGIGATSEASGERTGTVRFALTATVEEERILLFEESRPVASLTGTWRNRRIDLSDLAGRKVRLEFSTTTTPGSEEQPLAQPLWGNPQIQIRSTRDGRPNSNLVSLDTLRADFVGADYEGLPLTPALDARIARGTIFADAMTTFPSTTASHASLMTSTYRSEHGTHHPGLRIARKLPTLAEILAEDGYETAAFTENAMIAAQRGFARGFDEYDENNRWTTESGSGGIEETIDRATRWLERNRKTSFFLFVHTYEVHSPYEPPKRWAIKRPRTGAADGMLRTRDRYAGEVRHTDSVVEKLFATVSRLHLADDTVVIVTSDHGEEFGEHGSLGHSRHLYDEVMRVPLIFWGPGRVPEGRRIEGPVSLVDIAPTVLEFTGIPLPPGYRGESLGPLMEGRDRRADPIVFGEHIAKDQSLYLVARSATHKWIARQTDRGPEMVEIFDLRADPEERTNIVDDRMLQEEGLVYLTRLRSWAGSIDLPTEVPSELDAETEAKLRALGYLD